MEGADTGAPCRSTLPRRPRRPRRPQETCLGRPSVVRGPTALSRASRRSLLRLAEILVPKSEAAGVGTHLLDRLRRVRVLGDDAEKPLGDELDEDALGLGRHHL